MHGVKKTPVRSVTLDFADQKVMTADGLLYDVSANLVYRVEDATKALTLVDHVDQGCRAAIPIIVAEVIRVRDQAQLVDRLSLDRELSDRTQAWVARWGLVVEQAGFKTIAPNKSVLGTTQLRSKAMERKQALNVLTDGGLDLASALVMIGCERRPVAKSSRRYHVRTRGSASTRGARSSRTKAATTLVGASAGKAASPANPIKLCPGA
jgi:regulator of protease activity HflC (stomatin/prohibitin superfamily)